MQFNTYLEKRHDKHEFPGTWKVLWNACIDLNIFLLL